MFNSWRWMWKMTLLSLTKEVLKLIRLGQPNKTPNSGSSFMFSNFRRVNRSWDIVLNSRATLTFPSARRSLLFNSPPDITTTQVSGQTDQIQVDCWRCFNSSVNISYLGNLGLESWEKTSFQITVFTILCPKLFTLKPESLAWSF